MNDEMGKANSVDQRRTAMPAVSQAVDWLRANYGTEFVNAQMAIAIQARREYTKVLAEQGEAAAKRWHRANAHRCTFVGQENGRVVGMPSPYGQDRLATPPIGTPTAESHAGNSTPARAPVAGRGESPVSSPKAGV